MTALVPSKDATYAELWTSFAALLECYTAAHGLNRGALGTVEVTSECMVLRMRNRWLEITHHGGAATWQREDGSCATFDLQLDGRVSIGQGFEEMDAVAEKLAREITE